MRGLCRPFGYRREGLSSGNLLCSGDQTPSGLKGRNNPAQGIALGYNTKLNTRPEGARQSWGAYVLRPFRATDDFRTDTQGDALGWIIAAFQAKNRSLRRPSTYSVRSMAISACRNASVRGN
jgi:hypothetical protein